MSTDRSPQRIRRFDEEWNDAAAFSQAVRAGNQLWIAGQIPIDETGATVGLGDPAAQAEQVWRNMAAVLEAAGGDLGDLVATTTWLTDRAWREPITAVRRRWLQGPTYPTNTLVIIDGLARPEYLIEISAVAILSNA